MNPMDTDNQESPLTEAEELARLGAGPAAQFTPDELAEIVSTCRATGQPVRPVD